MAAVRAVQAEQTVDGTQPRPELARALAGGDPVIVFQPIMDLASGLVTGYEALSRFPRLGGIAPDVVFAQAHRQGRGHDLETLAIVKALESGSARPPSTVLSLNVSPSTLLTRQLHDVLPEDLHGLQLEITEHEQVADQEHTLSLLRELRHRGATVAVDDVGEGYAGLQQLMALEPDVIKLDRSLVTDVDHDAARAALIEAVSRFARGTGARVCAEGVERLEELRLLADLDVTQAQGWAIGRPTVTFADAAEEARTTCAAALSKILEIGDVKDSAHPDLAGVLSRIATTESLDELARLMSWVAAMLGCDKTQLSFCDDRLEYVEAVLPHAWVPEGRRFRVEDYPVTREVLEGNLVAQVITGVPGADAAESRLLHEDGFGSLLMVPVYGGRRPVGLLECYLASHRPWTRYQIRTMRCVAAVVGPVLTNLLRSERS
jgi:EAL domain-containing protein (putative c-di-GMP-specific phosphodiesterase class I)